MVHVHWDEDREARLSHAAILSAGKYSFQKANAGTHDLHEIFVATHPNWRDNKNFAVPQRSRSSCAAPCGSWSLQETGRLLLYAMFRLAAKSHTRRERKFVCYARAAGAFRATLHDTLGGSCAAPWRQAAPGPLHATYRLAAKTTSRLMAAEAAVICAHSDVSPMTRAASRNSRHVSSSRTTVRTMEPCSAASGQCESLANVWKVSGKCLEGSGTACHRPHDGALRQLRTAVSLADVWKNIWIRVAAQRASDDYSSMTTIETLLWGYTARHTHSLATAVPLLAGWHSWSRA